MHLVHAGKNHPQSRARHRGTAEIELLLAIPILLTMLFLIGCMLLLGPKRILTVFQPEPAAYHDAVANPNPSLAQDSDLMLDPAVDVLQTGANRVHIATASNPVTMQRGPLHFPTLTLAGQAQFISPSWSYSGWPDATADSPLLEQWIDNYAVESTAPWEDSLGLQPPFPP